MTTMMSNLIKENERQNARLTILEDQKKIQDGKSPYVPELEIQNSGEESIRFWKLQLEKLKSAMRLSFQSESGERTSSIHNATTEN